MCVAAYSLKSSVLFWLVQEAKRGTGGAAVFIARNRFAVLDKSSNQILIKNLRNEVTKQAACPTPTTDAIFYAGTRALICRSDDKVHPKTRNPTLLGNWGQQLLYGCHSMRPL